MTHKNRKKGFSCSLDVLHGRLGISKLQFLMKKISNLFFNLIFFKFTVIKTLDPDWIRIRVGIQPKMLDSDPDSMNPDPKH